MATLHTRRSFLALAGVGAASAALALTGPAIVKGTPKRPTIRESDYDMSRLALLPVEVLEFLADVVFPWFDAWERRHPGASDEAMIEAAFAEPGLVHGWLPIIDKYRPQWNAFAAARR